MVAGARVILACRDMDRANKAAEEVRKRSGNEDVIVKKLDLASLQSVRQLAKDVLASEERLDVLVNNAGRCISDEVRYIPTSLRRVLSKQRNILIFRYYELSKMAD